MPPTAGKVAVSINNWLKNNGKADYAVVVEIPACKLKVNSSTGRDIITHDGPVNLNRYKWRTLQVWIGYAAKRDLWTWTMHRISLWNMCFCPCPYSFFLSPFLSFFGCSLWYNRNGWLGVNTKVLLLLFFVFCFRSFVRSFLLLSFFLLFSSLFPSFLLSFYLYIESFFLFLRF